MELHDLKGQIYVTMRARFNASRRIKDTQQRSSYFIILASLLQFLLSIAIILNGQCEYNKLFTGITLISSVFIVIISNDSSFVNYGREEYILHSCGLELSKLLSEMDFDKNLVENFPKYAEKYHIILDKYDINHCTVDYELAKAQQRSRRVPYYVLKTFMSTILKPISYLFSLALMVAILYVILI